MRKILKTCVILCVHSANSDALNQLFVYSVYSHTTHRHNMHVEHKQSSHLNDRQAALDDLFQDFDDMELDSSRREESEIIRRNYSACFPTPSHYLKHLNNARMHQLLVDDLKQHLWRIKTLTDKLEAAQYIDALCTH